MLLLRLVLLLAVVILATVAAEDLFKLLTSILPILIALTVLVALGWSWTRHRRRF